MEKWPVETVKGRAWRLAERTARIAVAAAGTGVALFLLAVVDAIAENSAGWFALFHGLAINLILFEWAILALMAVPVDLPERYFATRSFERTGRLYERLGIRAFGRLVIGRIPFSGHRRDLSWFVHRSRHAEAVHLWACLGVALCAGSMAFQNRWHALFWTAGLSVPIHLYPIMLQRYNRSRIERLLTYRRHRSSAVA